MSYEVITAYYNMKLFTEQDLKLFIECGWITQEQMIKIVNSK